MMHKFHTLIPHTHIYVGRFSTLLHKSLKALPLGNILPLWAVERNAVVLAMAFFPSWGFPYSRKT